MTAEVTEGTRWQRRFEEEARRRFPLLIEAAVENPNRYADPAMIPKLVNLLSGGLIAADCTDAQLLTGLVRLSINTMLTVGAGPQFREYEEVMEIAVKLIRELEIRGARTSELLLLAAQYRAVYANTDRIRRSFIERAIANSVDARERASALLFFGRFSADVSDYSGARKIFLECGKILESEELRDLRPDFEASMGFAHYYYSEPAKARLHFEAAVRLGRPHLDHLLIRRPVSTALHFLGRLAADEGDYRGAIQLYSEAANLVSDFKIGHGYYHQRVAEILVDHGTLEESGYHLRTAESLFAQVGQVSNGLQLLRGTWARWYLRQGDATKARMNLNEAIRAARRERAPRVELVLLAELLRLRLQRQELPSTIPVLLRAGYVYLALEASHGPLSFVRQLRAVFGRASRVLGQRARAERPATGADPLTCPCGADHSSA